MSELKFIPNTLLFNLANAYFLAKMSEVAYQPLDQIPSILKTEYDLTKCTVFEDKKTDTQAFVVANKDFLVLSFRGTTTWADWMTNFKVAMVPASVGHVHFGFNASLNSIWDGVYDAVMSGKEKDQTLWVTGHSLGGALATLAVDRFTEENVQLVNGLYTFGQPRVGDKLFADNFDVKMKRRTFRFVDDEDVVTKIPIPPGYAHIGTEFFLDNKGVLFKSNTFWHWFRSSSEAVAIRSGEDANKYRAQNPGGLKDHGASFYAKHLLKNLEKKG